MSGFNEISNWAFDNLPIELEDTFEDWKQRISDDFEANGRLPLSSIFDQNDFDNLRQVFDFEHSFLVQEEDLEQKDPIESGMVGLFG